MLKRLLYELNEFGDVKFTPLFNPLLPFVVFLLKFKLILGAAVGALLLLTPEVDLSTLLIMFISNTPRLIEKIIRKVATMTERGWSLLQGDVYYRRLEIYPRCFDGLDFHRVKIYACPGGGPIATTRDDKKIVLAKDPDSVSGIDIYSSSGTALSSIRPKFYNNIVEMGWTITEKLVILLGDGTVLLYSVLGKLEKRFSLDGECKEVLSALIWETGFLILTKNFQLYAMPDYDSPYTIKLKSPGPLLSQPPLSWCVIKPQFSKTQEIEVLLALQSGQVLCVSESGVQELVTNNKGPFLQMALSPNGRLLACFTKTGHVWVGKVKDFTQDLTLFETKQQIPPQQLAWCGPDAITFFWEGGQESLLFLLGPETKFLKYTYDCPIHLVAEIDGIRVLSKKVGCELLQRVPSITTSIYKMGSTAPVAMLVTAYDQFEKKNPKSDSLIRNIKSDPDDKLSQAIIGCIEAASYEFDIEQQKYFLKAASFGKSFLSSRSFNSEVFVQMTKDLRVLNAIRELHVGMAITYQQYKTHLVTSNSSSGGATIVNADNLIDRLINRHKHLLASQIAMFLGVRSDLVLVHWASAKVHSELPDDAIVSQIVEKVRGFGGSPTSTATVSFRDIAEEAFSINRNDLAAKLLDYEVRPSLQIPLLIQMKKLDKALEKASKSGDCDLIDLLLINLKREGLNDFFSTLLRFPEAYSVWVKLCLESGDIKQLEQLYRFESKKDKLAWLCIHESQNAKSDEEINRNLKLASEYFKTAANTPNTNNSKSSVVAAVAAVATGGLGATFSINNNNTPDDHLFAMKATQDEIKLKTNQQELEISLNTSFQGLSLIETIHKCIKLGKENKAEKLKSDFGVGENQYAWTKIRAFGESGQWDALRKYGGGKAKAPPIGYVPLAEICLKYGNKSESLEYTAKVTDLFTKAVLLGRADEWSDAVAVAQKSKTPLDILLKLRSMCTSSSSALQIINSAIQQY
eukprot:TRINITY_DN5519_c0_g1_i1.p1 TRINITY_DN5519_c0_g1~~TRINITY_DN5519_c0_g1_i1.p1  ORF type:complete len:971 (-),score=174.24 TRINITY_DN5519_c0_g1_i1:202-3114(-)